MKNSRFIHFVEKNGKALCYSTMHNTMIAISAKGFKEKSLEEFEITYPNNYKAFIANKFIIGDSADEIAELRLRNKMETFGNRHFDLTVLPSMDTIYRLTEKIENTYVNVRINYDEKTLANIEELLNDLSGLDRKKTSVHFERVWQTESATNNEELKRIINLFIANGFNVSYINWHQKSCSCKAERLNQLAVNYDGKVFKCTGRKYTDEHSDGELDENGDVQWKPGRLEQRLGNTTFENNMCIKCKMLPVCMGPCSQKQIDVGPERLHEVCALNTLEMKMGEYIEDVYNNMVTANKTN